MSLGTLHTKLIVNDGDRVRYGPNDPISGCVVLTFTCKNAMQTTSRELFGPLKVSVILYGDSTIKMWKKLKNSYTYSRGQQPLFSVLTTIYKESFRTRAGESHQFPFMIYFPQFIESSSTSGWSDNARFPAETASSVPPTFSDKPSGIQGRLEALVEYRMRVFVNMPGLKVDTVELRREEHPMILYERPRPPQPLDTARHDITFDGGRDLGSGWHSILTCQCPRNLYCGQQVTFKVRVELRHLDATQPTSRSSLPKVYLTAFGVKLRSTTAVRGKRRLLAQPQMSVQNSVATLICAVDSTTPFAESENWTKQVITGKVPSVPSTFNSMNIARLYHIEIQMILECNGKTAQPVSKSYGIVVHPPPAPRDNETTVLGMLNRNAGGFDAAQALPEYERPPEYEAVSAE